MIPVVIGARGGSRRIPRKNVRPFAGAPMMTRPIAASREALARVIVSTDDAEIAAVARAAGAEVPFDRPAHLADDHTPIGAVVGHAIESVPLESEWVCLVYATAALLTPATLRAAAARLPDLPPEVDFLVSVCAYPHPVQRAVTADADGCLVLLDPARAQTRTQDLAPSFFDAGQFAFGRRDSWLRHPAYWRGRVTGHVLDRWEAVDIDTEDDWLMAERLWQLRAMESGGPGDAGR